MKPRDHIKTVLDHREQKKWKTKVTINYRLRINICFEDLYLGNVEVAGEVTVHVSYKDQEANVGEGPALLGKIWLNHLVLNWHDILHTSLGGKVDVLVPSTSSFCSERGSRERPR